MACLGPLAQAGTVDQAIAFGDVVFIAVPYGALPQIGRDYGKSLAGKIVLDADNAVASRDGAIADEVERDGIGVTSQKYLPGARLVRAFNTLSYMIFEREANRAVPRLAVPIAGDDREAVQVAAGLVRDAGFDPGQIELLPGVAQALRDADVLGRWGGEEFLLIMPGATLDFALASLERRRTLVFGINLPASGAGLRVSLSAGLATSQRHGRSLDEMIARADSALYAAKNDGRDLVRVAEEGYMSTTAIRRVIRQ